MVFFIFLIVFCILTFYRINRAHKEQFRRADYYNGSNNWSLTYSDLSLDYPRETLHIPSGKCLLNGFLYGKENKKGLIIISSGHRNCTEVNLSTMKYFVDNGWMVLSYDYTGYYNSEGKSMIDYIQSVKDLDAVLSYLENTEQFAGIPFLLFGHSLGAYTSAAALRFQHRISAVVAASGFDKPIEQWNYSIKRFTGRLGIILGEMAGIYLYIVFGKDTIRFSAVDGINSTDIPVLVISGVADEYYGGKSPIYIKRDKITNPNCMFMLMQNDRHNGHFDYMLTDAALDYQKLCRDNKVISVDKWIIMEQDIKFYDKINKFYLSALH
jgi:pimeloyl-ACP methyl ester carboxylesterase